MRARTTNRIARAGREAGTAGATRRMVPIRPGACDMVSVVVPTRTGWNTVRCLWRGDGAWHCALCPDDNRFATFGAARTHVRLAHGEPR
jgi:hypothetical protein